MGKKTGFTPVFKVDIEGITEDGKRTRITAHRVRVTEEALQKLAAVEAVPMAPRSTAARFAESLMRGEMEGDRCDIPVDRKQIDDKKGNRWHFGRVERRALLDFIYGGPPKSPEEKLFLKGGA